MLKEKDVKNLIMIYKSTIIFFLIVVSKIFCNSQENRYSFYEVEGYSMFSKDSIDILIENQEYPTNPQQFAKYEYIFLKLPIDTLFSTPYIQIKISEYSKLSESELKEIASDLYEYDQETHYLWRVWNSRLDAIIPTNYGTINIYCYSDKVNFYNDKKEFISFVNSIELSESAKYKVRVIFDNPLFNEIVMFFKNNWMFLVIIILVRRISKVFDSRRKIT